MYFEVSFTSALMIFINHIDRTHHKIVRLITRDSSDFFISQFWAFVVKKKPVSNIRWIINYLPLTVSQLSVLVRMSQIIFSRLLYIDWHMRDI